MKFQIGIPTLNRWDLLMPSLLMYTKSFPDTKIYILDNGKQGISIEHKNLVVIENEKNVGVGASWNILCEKIFEESDCSLILNDDIYLGKTTADINSLIQKKPNQFITATPDWCAFIISKDIFKKVGRFDECFFPAYYEDNSYAYRMKLKGVMHTKSPYLNPEIYRVSQSIEKDKSIFDYRIKNKELYIEMWGGLPEREKYLSPFNKKK
jgi:GT2 family glycosyltransferase